MTMSRDAAAVTLVGRAGTHPQISGNSAGRVRLRIITRRFEKDGATAYFTEVKADVVGLDVARMGARFARVAFEPRETTDAAEGTDLAAPADGQQSDLQEPG